MSHLLSSIFSSLRNDIILDLNMYPRAVYFMIYEKITERRTIRRFKPKSIPKKTLERCVNAARLSPSARNLQPLKFIVVNDKALLEKVFPTLKWAGYIPNYRISDNEVPQAYIVILLDTKIRDDACHDVGIAAMSISMVASEEGLGSCIMRAVDRDRLRAILKISGELRIELVVSLGYPAHESKVEEMKGEDVKYWMDEEGTFHIPKRDLKSILRWNSL
ncbi:MAG TPA: nitroreductase family protein [Candidatus Bathyarchaeia archaeon]|nr:nitroreductase family protein [Candidatus Bathyarchaeia archaeon]